MSAVDTRGERIGEDIKRVNDWTDNAIENGLPSALGYSVQAVKPRVEVERQVSGNQVESKEEIVIGDTLEQIRLARKDLSNKNYDEAEYHLSLAVDGYSRAITSAGWLWRFNNIYAGPLWLYVVSFLPLIFSFYYFGFNLRLTQALSLPPGSIEAVAWGMIGSILRGVWALMQNVNDRNYRKSWIISFMNVPFIGAVLGAVVYLVFVGGLVATQSITPADVKNPLILMAFAGFAGFKWEEAKRYFLNMSNFLAPK